MLTYTEVTPAKFSSLQASMASHGLKITVDAGVVKELGAVVDYDYTPATQTLTVDVKHAPWTVKLESFTAAIDAAIKDALGNAPQSESQSAPQAADPVANQTANQHSNQTST